MFKHWNLSLTDDLLRFASSNQNQYSMNPHLTYPRGAAWRMESVDELLGRPELETTYYLLYR